MKHGFTLLELLIVIGVLAILSTIVTVVLNPAELLKEARDIQRVADLQTVKKAIDFYISRSGAPNLDVANPNLNLCNDLNYIGSSNDGSRWYASNTDVSGSGTFLSSRQTFILPMNGLNQPISGIVPETTIRNVDGTGWVAANILSTPGGPAISKLPNDPNPDTSAVLPSTGRYYAYRCEGLRYELNASMESIKYASGGGKDVESRDGGTSACSGTSNVTATRCTQLKADLVYEIGNDPDLNL